MNLLCFYDRSKVPWTLEESENVRKEYDSDLLNIIDIANIHKRTPGSIAYKLKHLGLIVHSALSRGYAEYKTSELYIEVCNDRKKDDDEKKAKKEETLKSKEESTLKLKPTNKYLINEINLLKEEISEIKKDIKQILSYITSIYEFEKDE